MTVRMGKSREPGDRARSGHGKAGGRLSLKSWFGNDGGAPRNRARFNLRNRLLLVGGALGLCSLALVGRAFDVQVYNNDFYLQQGDARSLREIPIPTSRGMITDRNGEPLAVSTPVESVWGNPQELLKNPARIPELAAALGVPPDYLLRKLSQRASKEFMYLQRRINPDQARAVLAHNIPGVFSQREYRRFYPQGEAMAHILGFTNIDDRGQEGLELAFDDWLRGKPGAKRVIRDGQGRTVESVDLVKAAEPGQDLLPGHAQDRGVEEHVLAAGEVRVKARAQLNQWGDPSVDEYFALAGCRDARYELEDGALAATVTADDAHRLPPGHTEADVSQSVKGRRPGAATQQSGHELAESAPFLELEALAHPGEFNARLVRSYRQSQPPCA